MKHQELMSTLKQLVWGSVCGMDVHFWSESSLYWWSEGLQCLAQALSWVRIPLKPLVILLKGGVP